MDPVRDSSSGERLLRALVLLTALGLIPSRAANGQNPRTEYAQEFYRSFKGDPSDRQGLEVIGPDAEQSVKFEPEGLRITVPPGHPRTSPNIGVMAVGPVKGDFEITLSYTILQEPEPIDSPMQTRFTLIIQMDRPGQNRQGLGDRATFSRKVGGKGGTQYFPWMSAQEAIGDIQTRGKHFPAQSSTGRLRLVRSGNQLSYLTSEGADEAFVLLETYPFWRDDVQDVRLVASTGGPIATLDVRVHDLRIRADELPNPTSIVPQNIRSKRFLAGVELLGLLIAGASLILLGMWLYTRRRRKVEEVHSADAVEADPV